MVPTIPTEIPVRYWNIMEYYKHNFSYCFPSGKSDVITAFYERYDLPMENVTENDSVQHYQLERGDISLLDLCILSLL